MADENPNQAATIPIPTTEPELPLVPLDESALNPEYDPTKDQRASFLKTPINPTGPTISPALDRSVGQVIKEAATENIPQFSSRTVSNPNYGKQSFLPDSEIMTQQQRREAPALAGALDVAGELGSPATIGTVAATAGIGEAGVIPKVLSGLFAGQIATSVYDQYPALKDAVNRAQTAKTKDAHDDAFADAQRILTHMGADTVMGLLAAKHGAEGAKEILDTTTGSGVPDQASTFKNPGVEPAPEPEETHPEMNRETVKKLQDLGYSNQHITNFNIGEIRDILKNQTSAAEYKPAAAPETPKPAPEPDKFAEAGGKLVGPSPKAAVSTPAETPATTETGAADPIEDLIMSDKIGGKKVRGATLKATKPAAADMRAVARQSERSEILQETNGKAFIDTDGSLVGLNQEHEDTVAEHLGLEPPEDEDEEYENTLHQHVDNLTKKGLVRVAGYGTKDSPLYIQLSVNPNEYQRAVIGKAIRDQGSVIFDLTPNGFLGKGKTPVIAGEARTPGDLWRKVDEVFKPAPPPEAFAEHGGKFVGKSPEAPAPAPNQQDIVSKELQPSTKYTVPTDKPIEMLASGDRSEADTLAHETAHAVIALQEGLRTGGIGSSLHDLAEPDARAIHLLYVPRGETPGSIRPDKIRSVVKSGLAGVAMDEIRGTPRSKNHNMPLDANGDGQHAYEILRAAGFNHKDALAEMDKIIDENVATLSHPAVTSVIDENLGFREKSLSRQFHYSAERLQNMNAEIERRKANGQTIGTINNGPSNEGRAGNDQADVARGEGEVSAADKGLAPEGEEGIVSEEKIAPNFSSKASDFIGEEYLPEDAEDKMYHVTTAKNKILVEGLKSRKQTGSAGLGGGFMNQAPDKISVTFDEGHANQIASRMNLAVQAAKNKVTPQQVLDTMISDAGIADDTPEEVGQMLGAPENVREDWEDFNKWFDENYKQGDSYSLLQELDDALPSIYTETSNPVRVGFTASKNQMAKIKPNQIHIFEVEARKGAKAEHIPDESELRFAPEDVQIIKGPTK